MPTDKLLHALVGALIVATLFPLGPGVAAVSLATAAVGKELYDAQHRESHTPEFADAAVTFAGGIGSYVWLSLVPYVKEALA